MPSEPRIQINRQLELALFDDRQLNLKTPPR